jgi:Zn-dependent protease
METIFTIIILIFSVIIHEVAHGAVANHLGDPTAKDTGRLTLNPINHLDPIGSVLLPLILVIIGSPFLIGWAKPVPVNPYNLRNPKKDMARIAVAGPAINFFIAIFFALLIQFFALPEKFLIIFSIIIFINILLAVFNLLPIPPLDGSKILFSFFPQSLEHVQIWIEQFSIFLFFGFLFLLMAGIIPLFQIVLLVFYFIAGPEMLEILIQFLRR